MRGVFLVYKTMQWQVSGNVTMHLPDWRSTLNSAISVARKQITDHHHFCVVGVIQLLDSGGWEKVWQWNGRAATPEAITPGERSSGIVPVSIGKKPREGSLVMGGTPKPQEVFVIWKTQVVERTNNIATLTRLGGIANPYHHELDDQWYPSLQLATERLDWLAKHESFASATALQLRHTGKNLGMQEVLRADRITLMQKPASPADILQVMESAHASKPPALRQPGPHDAVLGGPAPSPTWAKN